MICIYCFHTKTRVANSRPHKKQPQVWRRRQCPQCETIFTTYERPASDDLIVTRRRLVGTGAKHTKPTEETFNIGKLTLSIARAAQHNQQQAEYDSFSLASTIEIKLLTIAAKNSTPNKKDPIHLRVSAQEILHTTHAVLKRFDELTSMQYAMQHGLITSVRRRGRPSTTATNDAA